MRITAVEAVFLTAPLGGGAIQWSGGFIPKMNTCLVRVTTDAGITGLGETYAGVFAPEAVRGVVRHFETLCLGEDAANITALWQRLYAGSLFWGRNGLAVSVLSAIEMALWDLNGKALDVPVYRLLGGLANPRLPVYASGGLDQPEASFVAELNGYLEQGFRAIKFRIGHGPLADGTKAAVARRTAGDGFQLMCDAVQGHNPSPWRAGQAVAVAEALAPHGLSWFEEPCAATDFDGYAAVRRKSPIPIAGGESSVTIHEFKLFFEREALDIAQPDAAHCGGIGEFLRIAHLADAYGVGVVPHVWGSGPAIMANLHAALATPICRLFEFPTILNPLRHQLLLEPLTMNDGRVEPPAAPGLGVTLDERTLAEFPYETGCEVRMANTR